MSIYCPTIKREENKVYISESSQDYAVLVGRREEPRACFSIEEVLVKDEKYTKNDGGQALWFILEWRENLVPQIVREFSTFNYREVRQKAHELALERAKQEISLSKMIAQFPVHHPNAQTPTRDPDYKALTKIIDNSRHVTERKDSELVEYTKEPVEFQL